MNTQRRKRSKRKKTQRMHDANVYGHGSFSIGADACAFVLACVCSDGEIARSGREEKKKNGPDGELWAMASMAHERDTLVRAYPLWRFRLSKPKFPSCCINPHRSCGVTHINRLICFSRAEFGIV
jgi:hypothetical protein